MTFPPWPPAAPFRESQRDTENQGTPDFPGSSGGREQGKFRPSRTPRLTQVAVVNDDGTQIGTATIPGSEEVIFWLKALYLGMVTAGMIEDVAGGVDFIDL